MLDLCCGTGQLACYFSKRRFNVFCLDRSMHMLNCTQKNLKKIINRGSVNFINADMVSLATSSCFGLVVCTCDSINYIANKKSLHHCFQRVYSSLISGGVFIFDMQTPYGINKKAKEIEIIDNDEMYIVNKQEFNGDNVGRIIITGFVRDANGLLHRFDEKFINKAFELKSVFSCLQNVGFQKVLITDESLQNQSVNLETLEWAYIVAKKI